MQAFFVPTDEIGAYEGSRVGIEWLARLEAEGTPGEPMIIVPAKNMARNNEFMAAASARYRWETTSSWRRSSWPGGPLLALFPDRGDLAEILSWSYRITHLCVVESSTERPQAWLLAARPTYLVGDATSVPELDAVVVGALLDLTAFVNTAHYANIEDVAMGIRTCQQLQAFGYLLDEAAFEGFALANGWDPEAASRFGDTVRKVAQGHRFRNPDLKHWPARATQATRKRWRERGERHRSETSRRVIGS